MIATYADRITVHPDRYGSTRPLPPSWVVIHTSEGPEGENAAEQLASFMERPGDRPNNRGGFYGSSYHAVADTDLRVIPATEDSRVAYAAPGANTLGLHICIPGTASQSRSQWLSGASRGAIRTVAAYLLDVKAQYGIPTERLTVAELRAGTRGYCDHAAIRDAFGRTTHYDVGPDFPWDVLAGDIRDLRPDPPTPTPGELNDMLLIDYYDPSWTCLVLAGGTIRWVSSGLTVNVLVRGSTPRSRIDDPSEMFALLSQFPCEGQLPPSWVGNTILSSAWS